MRIRRAGSWISIVIVAMATSSLMIAAADSPDRPTYTRDILPLLQSKCQECHRPGQIAPMSLLTYEETRPWARAIQKEVISKRMPPFYAAGPIGHWKNDLRLTDAEIRTFLSWIDQGTARGNPDDKPSPRIWPDSEWSFGEPNVIVDFPEHEISTTGPDDYVTLFSEYTFEEDAWLSGVILAAQEYDSLHHVHIFTVPEDFEVPPGGKSPGAMNALPFPYFYTWFPGATVDLLPEGQGIPVHKGSRFSLVAHFAPSAEPKTEHLRLGIYWANGKIERLERNAGVLMTKFQIPPHQSDYTYRGSTKFVEDGWVTHFRVHMHLRGKSAQFFFRYPDGTSELVFDLPQYSFDWQRHYYLSEPIRVPKDTIFETVATWDNSADNLLNPNPDSEVGWGPSTANEMFGANAYYTPVKKLAKSVVVKDGHVIQSVEAEGNEDAT